VGDTRSWEKWVEHYEDRGYRVLAPAYPGFEVEVEALNEDPSPIEALTIPAVVEHLESIVGELENPPIFMAHSAGGLFTQILLDHGDGAAGVVIDSAPAEGVRVTPVAQIRSLFPVLKNPANRHKAVGFTKEQFHMAFANTLSREESDEVYERRDRGQERDPRTRLRRSDRAHGVQGRRRGGCNPICASGHDDLQTGGWDLEGGAPTRRPHNNPSASRVGDPGGVGLPSERNSQNFVLTEV